MKRKTERFRIIEARANVIEPSKPIYTSIRGRWHAYFGNTNPITLELACGRGEYSIGLSQLYPSRNFVGVDIKGERIWKGSTIAEAEGLGNVAFLRSQILLIENFFEPAEVNEIWMTFPDPRPRKRDVKRRLTSPRYLDIFKRLITPGGFVRLKTDNTPLYQYTLDVLKERNDIGELAFTDNIYTSPLRPECYDIVTRYEKEFSEKGETIKYIRFIFR